MNKTTIRIVLLIVGIILVLVSLLADYIGIGTYPGINSRQVIGIVFGVVLVLIGLYLGRKK